MIPPITHPPFFLFGNPILVQRVDMQGFVPEILGMISKQT
jgi:hypothetical protein